MRMWLVLVREFFSDSPACCEAVLQGHGFLTNLYSLWLSCACDILRGMQRLKAWQGGGSHLGLPHHLHASQASPRGGCIHPDSRGFCTLSAQLWGADSSVWKEPLQAQVVGVSYEVSRALHSTLSRGLGSLTGASCLIYQASTDG